MLMYLVSIGNYMKYRGNEYNFDKLKTELDHFMVHERRIAKITEHSLARNTRKSIFEAVQDKQLYV